MIQENHDIENNILYELLIYAEWQQEPEVQGKSAPEKLDGHGSDAYFTKWLGPFAPQPCPPVLVRQLISLQMPWAFAVGGNGAVIAFLQDAFLEIRTSRDEYGTIIGRTPVSKDPYPQWRRILWSPDCTMLVFAYSNGKLDFYDLIGAHMFTIENMMPTSSQNGKQNFRYAIAGMAFSDVRVKNTQWSYEFLAINYMGEIFGYYISPSDGFKLSHTSSVLRKYYPSGISCFIYHPVDNMLIICGNSRNLSANSSAKDAAEVGMSCWRMLSGSPYYKRSIPIDEHMEERNWKMMLYQYKLYQSINMDLVFKMSISPNGKILATIHVSGALMLWDLPSLRLKKNDPLKLQPNYNDVNPHYCEPGMKKRSDILQYDPFHFCIIDINWWSSEAIIIARRCGAVSVSSIKSLQNLLGVSPEWFEPSPAVTSFCDRGFLAMECEARVKGKRRATDDTDDDEESSDDEEPSVFAYSYHLAQKALYFITDNDRFQPPRKKVKMIIKTYRLLCLKSTTPEELYTRKINNEEYGEALALAKTYGLDSDLVYQRQWRKMPATVESIHDYLSKIKKRSWVLHECMERVPESFEAAKELLDYGLQGTDLKTLIAIGKGEDHGRFILSPSYDDDNEMDEADYETSLSLNSGSHIEDIYEMKRLSQQKKREELLKEINFKKLTLEQKQLCQCRLKLLNYLDRLTTYEIILGGSLLADEHYDHNFFRQFRSQSGLEAAIYFACNSNWEAVATLFTYHGPETLPHRLAILSNFPETTSPIEYQSLLPLYNERELIFYPWDEHSLREPDWCEIKCKINPPSEDFVQEFYEKSEEFLKYRQLQLSHPLVTEWFIERAKEIESRSGLVENALQLLKLGMQRNIQGLEKLLDDTTTLDIIIHECGMNIDLSLQMYEEMTDFDKVKLIMFTTTKDNFMKNVQQLLLPFLRRCSKYEHESHKKLFKTYILSISKNELFYCKAVLKSFKSDPTLIVTEFNELVSLALDCVYCCERTDELKNANEIYELLLLLPDIFSKNMKKLYSLPSSVTNLQKHICVAELLDKNGVAVPLAIVEDIYDNPEEIKKLLTKLTRMASHRIPVLDEEEWKNLLADILEMQKLLFGCISYEDCYEIVLHSLLCSGKSENITFAGKMMECNNKQRKEHQNIVPQSFKLPYAKSVALVLAASQEYFNSSADALDPCMSLAKGCLNLIEDVPASIEEESDLIASISLLQEFSVSVLPLQVRLFENRMMIVQEALKKKQRNYKKASKIMKLANLLRAGNSSNQEREGKVLTLIGEHAFQAKDYNECLSACQKLMDGAHEEGWRICYTLGGCNEFENIPARSCLMSFSLAYCSEDLIDTILRSKAELKLQVLQERVKFLVGDIPMPFISDNDIENKICDMVEGDSNGINALWQTSGKTLQALQSTTQTAKVVLTSVKSVQFWKDAINWIQPPGLSWNGENVDVEENSNQNLIKQGICAFYDGLIEESHMSKLEANYQRYARPDLDQSLEISSSILEASLIQDGFKESATTSLEDSILLDIAKAHLPEDSIYSLYVLLSLQEKEKAETLFKILPSSPIVLQLASWYWAILIHIKCHKIYKPFDGIKDMTDSISFCKETLALKDSYYSKVDEKCQKYFDHLEKYDKMLYDFVQAEILHSIGGGVDATRFANDDVYKKDTILGISMTLDDSIFQTALSLAQHYNIPLWDLYITHLEYMFSESNVLASMMNARMEKLGLCEKLMLHKKELESRLRDYVYPGISGKDHEKLLICLLLLENCGDNDDKFIVKPSVHIKLLNKLKAAMKNVDYKLLMNPECSHLYLIDILNESNVHMFAKSASSIPKKGNSFYEPSNIYCLWMQKYFFEGKPSNSKIPITKTDWIHRYESCADNMMRLNSSEVLDLIDAIVFSEKALEKMTIDCRSEIVKRCMKFCRGKASMHKNNAVLNLQCSEWAEVAAVLSSYHAHLQRLEDETLVQLRKSLDSKIKDYCKDFDLSKSTNEKLQSLLARIVIEGPDIELLRTFISCCPPDISWEPADAYIKAIDIILQRLKEQQNFMFKSFKDVLPIQALEAILHDITKQEEELIMIEEVAQEKFHEFCQDPDVTVCVRLMVLQLLEKTNCISSEYYDLLLLYRTQAVVSSMWPDLQVSEEEVKDEFQRKFLFDTLLSLCRNVDHFTSLAKLLSHWPPFPYDESINYHNEQWTKLLCGLVSLSTKDSLIAATNIIEKAIEFPCFDEQCCKEVFRKVKEQGNILYTLKCALKTNYSALHVEAVELLKKASKIIPENYDSELLDLLLRHNMTSQIISTGLYTPLIEYLLHCQDDSEQDSYKSLDNVVKELYESGYQLEAGSLLLIKNSTHTGLSTFSSAVSILQNWLSMRT